MSRVVLPLAAAVFLLSLMTDVQMGMAARVRFVHRAAIGYDVSFPECGQPLPHPRAFAIVGVNGGKASTGNPCFRRELHWARQAPLTTGVRRVSLYVNTGDPGDLKERDWPRHNLDPVTGKRVRDPYGVCSGRNRPSCAWQYGWNMADRDARRRKVKNPAHYQWWLDVETANTWESNLTNNRADLEGMVDFFHSVGITVGVYSTDLQWARIVGFVSGVSPLYTLTEWMPGASRKGGARIYCSIRPFTGGGRVVMTQWFNANTPFDGDYICARSVRYRPPPGRRRSAPLEL